MNNTAFTFDDVLLTPNYNRRKRKEVDLTMTDHTKKLSLSLPVMTANMDTITENAMANFIYGKGGIGVLHRFCSIDRNVEMFKKVTGQCFVSVGCSDTEMQRVEALKSAGANFFCIDVAHAHSEYVGEMLKKMREILKNECIMAGNVATYDGARYLESLGADIIKVGIGPGAVCTTRIKTGYGVPQLSAIHECSRIDRSIVADGGIRNPGDIVKALAFGADFVMIGSMLAGTDPTPGKILYQQDGEYLGAAYKTYRGMASKEVAEDYFGGLQEWKTAEGVSVTIPYRNNQDEIIADIVGGLRSGLTYGGNATFKELQQRLNFRFITSASRAESLPHRTLS